jgi:hypothetical protein
MFEVYRVFQKYFYEFWELGLPDYLKSLIEDKFETVNVCILLFIITNNRNTPIVH